MAILKQRLCRKNASGSYDNIYLETTADLVLRVSDATKSVETSISSLETTVAGLVPQTRTINGLALTGNITLKAANISDVSSTAEMNAAIENSKLIPDDTLSGVSYKLGFDNGALYYTEVSA